MNLPRGAGILIAIVFVLFLLVKLAIIALGGWLVYLGFTDLNANMVDGWTFLKWALGAFVIYVGLTFKLTFNYSK